MVTQIDPRINESSVRNPDTNNWGGALTQEKVEEVVLSEAALAAAEEILRSRKQAERVSPWARFRHWLTALPGELVGPPMTQQERLNLKVSRAIHERQGGALL